jgi:hypothetical protein
MKKYELKNHPDRSAYFFNVQAIIIFVIMLTIVSVIYNNSLRSSPIFLFLLALGVGASSVIGANRGGLFGLVLVSIWIAVKQIIGVWSEDRLLSNLLEVLMAGITFAVNGFYHDNLSAHFKEYLEIAQKLKQFDLEDTAIGLIKPTIGLLRLKEETDRAIRFRRPFSFILILLRPSAEQQWKTGERLSIMRAAATTVKNVTRAMDIPFLVCEDKIALILPDTEINGANKALNKILRQMMSTYILTNTGKSEPMQNHAQIRYGGGVFLGGNSQSFEMLEMTEKSLQKNIENNSGSIFQNIFIDWEVIGDSTTTNLTVSTEAKKKTELPEKAPEAAISPIVETEQRTK